MPTAQDPLSLLKATCREIEKDIQERSSVWVFIVETRQTAREHDFGSRCEANCTDKTEARGVAEMLICQLGGTIVSFFVVTTKKRYMN